MGRLLGMENAAGALLVSFNRVLDRKTLLKLVRSKGSCSIQIIGQQPCTKAIWGIANMRGTDSIPCSREQY